ncbi:MAG: YncE family protein [Actinomycetota bacterium]|nr:YncE family protein [Actinomycetota bacterium]
MRRALLVLAALLTLPLALLACGEQKGGKEGETPGTDASALPYPPAAAEPVVSPEVEGTPPGQVVEVGNGPEGVAFDPRTGLVAVGTREPGELVLVNGASGEISERVRIPSAPRHLDLARPGGPVLVPAEDANTLVEVSLPDGDTRETEVGENPHDVAFLDDRIYVGDEFSSTMSVVEDGRLVRQIPVDAQPGGVIELDDRVGIVSVRAYTLELFSLEEDLQAQGSQNAGLGPTHVVRDAEGRLFITDTRGDAIVVYETQPRLKFLGRLELPGAPYGIAIDRERGRVWVTLTARNEVVELNAADQPEVLRRFPTVRQPNTLAVSPGGGRLFIASRTDGTLQLLDPGG